jgi:hypothetical protein
MRWKPRLLSVEQSIGVIVFATFLVVLPACLYGYGVDLHDWKKCAELSFWVIVLVYAVWSGIEAGRRNRRERIHREQGLSSNDSR